MENYLKMANEIFVNCKAYDGHPGEEIITFKTIVTKLNLQHLFSKQQLLELSNAYISFSYDEENEEDEEMVDGICITTESTSKYILMESYTPENFETVVKQLILSELMYIGFRK